MRNSTVIDEAGYFWLPATPESKLPGTLHISERGGITLDVIGMFGDPAEAFRANSSLKRIIGLIRNQNVTLDSCVYKKQSLTFGGISKSVIHATVAYLGVAYDDEEAVTFEKVRFSVEGLDEWLLITGLEIDLNLEGLGANIKYKRPEQIALRLPGDIKLEIGFSWSLAGGGTEFKEAKISQKASMSLVSSAGMPIESFFPIISKLTNFLSFAIDKTVMLESLDGFSTEIKRQKENGSSYQIPIEVVFESIPYDEVAPKISWTDMLFRYDQVKDELEKMLAKWFSNYETSEPAFNLYFAYKSGAQKYIDGRFLSLAQGIETLHRRNSSGTVMPPGEFRELVQALLKSCPEDKKEWLNTRIAYGNEISLRQRLTEMIEPFKALYGTEDEISTFIKRILDTRNYLTHFDDRLSERAARGIDLWRLCMKVEVLFQLHFLRLIGLSVESITNIANAVESIKWKLRQ